MVTKKQILECGKYGLIYQFGSKAKLLSEKLYSKNIDSLNQEEIDKLGKELHGSKK